jgi:hypothetical protein
MAFTAIAARTRASTVVERQHPRYVYVVWTRRTFEPAQMRANDVRGLQ